MRRIAFALLATGALIAIAWAQANNSNTWVTTGNQTVGGVVQMCPRAADNVAVPCSNASASAAGAVGAGYPAGATPVAASIAVTTTASGATLPAAAGKLTYICGYMLNANATAATFGQTGITGTIAALNYIQPIAAAPAVAVLTQTFTPCIPGSAVNTAIVTNVAAAGAGGLNTAYAWGYQL